MSLLFVDSFDVIDATTKWSSYSIYGALNNGQGATFPTGRYGAGRAMDFHNYASQLTLPNFLKFITPSAQVFMGAAFQINAGQRLFRLLGDAGVTIHLTLYASGGVLFLYRGDVTGGTLLAQSGPTQYIDTQWNYFEIGATIADSGGRVEVRVNGIPTPVIDFTGDTKNSGTSTNIDAVQICNPTRDVHLVVDDLYVCNSAGTRNNSFLGEIRVTACLPSGAGSNTQFTPTGSANNWDNVNDVPPVLTTYNASSVLDQKDTYAMTDLPAGVGQIFGMQTVLLASKSDAGAASLKSVVRLGVLHHYGAPYALSSNPLAYCSIREVDPSTNVAWLVAAVNSMEFGAQVS